MQSDYRVKEIFTDEETGDVIARCYDVLYGEEFEKFIGQGDDFFGKENASSLLQDSNYEMSDEIRQDLIDIFNIVEFEDDQDYDSYQFYDFGDDDFEDEEDELEYATAGVKESFNLREALNKIDLDTYNKYDLLNLYEACDLKENEKRALANIVYDQNDPSVIYDTLNNRFVGGKEIEMPERVKDGVIHEELYKDVSGIMGEPNETYSIEDLENYWNAQKDNDPSLRTYSNYNSWLRDTLSYMEEVEDANDNWNDEDNIDFDPDNRMSEMPWDYGKHFDESIKGTDDFIEGKTYVAEADGKTYGSYKFIGKVNIDGEELYKFEPLDKEAEENTKDLAADNEIDYDGFAYMTDEEVFYTFKDDKTLKEGVEDLSEEEIYNRVVTYLENHPYDREKLDDEDVCDEVAANLFGIDYYKADGEISHTIFNAVTNYFEEVDKLTTRFSSDPQDLYKEAMKAYDDGDDDFFYNLSDDELVILQSSCHISEGNPFGAAYDDEVFDAISDRTNSREIFNRATKMTLDKMGAAELNQLHIRYFSNPGKEKSLDELRTDIYNAIVNDVVNESVDEFEFDGEFNAYYDGYTEEDEDKNSAFNKLKNNVNESLAARLVDFIRDYDYYHYSDTLEVGDTDEDAVKEMDRELADPKSAKSLLDSLIKMSKEDSLDDEQKEIVSSLISGVQSVVDKHNTNIEESIDDSKYITDEIASKTNSQEIKDAIDKNNLSVLVRDNTWYTEKCPNGLGKALKDEMKRLYPDLKHMYGESKSVKESVDEEPYTKEQIEQDLKTITNNFTEKEGELKCGFEEEKNFGVEILMQHYKVVEASGDGDWYHISYAEPVE